MRRSEILRPVSMAVGTSLLAYTCLAALPFPILREMGIFTMLGLCAAWLTAMLWLPLLAARMPDASRTPALRFLAWLRPRWPRVGRTRGFSALLLLLCLGSAMGLWRLKSNDDVRQLYASDPEALRQQEKVQQLLHLPATGQFFLVSAPDEQGLLEREESLGAELSSQGIAYQGVSLFVPSLKQQALDESVQQSRIYAPGALATKLFRRLESPGVAKLARKLAAAPAPPWLPEAWLASPISAPFRTLWMGQRGQAWCSIVTLASAFDGKAAPPSPLSDLASRHPGVQYVDHLSDLAGLMGSFRRRIGWLLVIGYAAVAVLLLGMYKREAWRVLLPTLIASLAVAGAFGWLGLNYNLFCVFGILMSLDMGVDYGIFMQDRRSGNFGVAFLSATLAAWSTLLSFGLLALSHTPALRIFGLSVLLGIGGSWLLAPCFQREKENEPI